MFSERSGTVDCERGLAAQQQPAHNLNTLDFFIRERPAPLCTAATTSHWDLVERECYKIVTVISSTRSVRPNKYKYNQANLPVITIKMIPRTDLWPARCSQEQNKNIQLDISKVFIFTFILSHKYLFLMIHLFFLENNFTTNNLKVSIIFSVKKTKKSLNLFKYSNRK